MFGERVRSVYRPLAEFLATLPGGIAGKAALDSANAADKKYWVVFWEQVDVMSPIVAPSANCLSRVTSSVISTNALRRRAAALHHEA